MTPTPNNRPRRWDLRLRLSTLLGIVTIFGLAFGWYVEQRARNEWQQLYREQLRSANLERQVYDRQLVALKTQLAVRGAGARVYYFWANADEFIAALKHAEEAKFLEMAPAICDGGDDVFDDAMEQVVKMLDDAKAENRRRAVITLNFVLQQQFQRLDSYAERAVAKLILLLDDPVCGGESLGVLGRFGDHARPALPKLKAWMMDDKNHYAPAAARAVYDIDSNEVIGPRLIELIDRKHPAWYTAAFELGKHVPPDEARRVISKRFDEAVNDAERNMAVQALNQLPPK